MAFDCWGLLFFEEIFWFTKGSSLCDTCDFILVSADKIAYIRYSSSLGENWDCDNFDAMFGFHS